MKNKPTKTFDRRQLLKHTRRIFSISQAIPSSVVLLLIQKNRRELSQKQQKQIYDQIKEKNIFPILTHPKTIIDFCSQIRADFFKSGQALSFTEDCFIILDGSIKVFQESSNTSKQEMAIGQSLRLSVNAVINFTQLQSIKVQKEKLTNGQVLVMDPDDQNFSYIVASSATVLRIPYHLHSMITMISFMAELKKKQQFFRKISLFQRHYRTSLEDFINCLQQVRCGFGKKIFEQGETIKNIYIIKQGEFILSKNICTDQVGLKNVKTHFGIENYFENEIKNNPKHFRSCPYKIIGSSEILGDSQYLFNKRVFMSSMRCHRQGSFLYRIPADLFFKKLYVSQNGNERVQQILEDNFLKRKKEIEQQVDFNTSNTLLVKFMPNSTFRYKTQSSNPRQQKELPSRLSTDYSKSISERSQSFFQKMNKTITNPNKNPIRRRNQSKVVQSQNSLSFYKTFKTPAVVQQVIDIVNQKKAYQRLRNIGSSKSTAFQFDRNNVPHYIKRKYGQLFDSKKVN